MCTVILALGQGRSQFSPRQTELETCRHRMASSLEGRLHVHVLSTNIYVSSGTCLNNKRIRFIAVPPKLPRAQQMVFAYAKSASPQYIEASRPMKERKGISVQ